jgi:hypothetical protein
MKSRPPKGASGEVAPGVAPIDTDAAAFCGSEGSGARPPLIHIRILMLSATKRKKFLRTSRLRR